MTGHVSLPNLPLTSLQQCGSNPHGRIEGPQLEDLAADVVNNPHERLRSPPTCTQAPTRPTRKRRPLCSGLFLVRYYYLSSLPLSTTTSSGTHTRNSQHGQPMKNVEGATHPESVARNPNIMGGGEYFR